MKSGKVLFTCEHGGYEVSEYLKEHLSIDQSVLRSHRGWDLGALRMARYLSKKLKAELLYTEISRLVIDTNRQLDNGALSTFSKNLPEHLKKPIIKDYAAYRKKVEASAKKKTLVFSVHSFVPQYKGKTRATDIGILFRPFHEQELRLAKALKKGLADSGLKVHFNRPYRGYTDCLLNDVLDRYPKTNGLFLEFNQKLLSNHNEFSKTSRWLEKSLHDLMSI